MHTPTCKINECLEEINTCSENRKHASEALLPRERLERYGAAQLRDEELLAILLATGSRDCTVMELSIQLLQSHKGITGLRDLCMEELMQQKGIGTAKATTVLAAIELGKRIHNRTSGYRDKIDSTADAGVFLNSRMRHLAREHFNVLLLNSVKAVIALENISIGTLDSATVHPREVFKQAIRHSASMIILAHNHPSGACIPSEQDIQTTKRMIEAGEIVGIPVIDHIIVGENMYYSFSENSLM